MHRDVDPATFLKKIVMRGPRQQGGSLLADKLRGAVDTTRVWCVSGPPFPSHHHVCLLRTAWRQSSCSWELRPLSPQLQVPAVSILRLLTLVPTLLVPDALATNNRLAPFQRRLGARHCSPKLASPNQRLFPNFLGEARNPVGGRSRTDHSIPDPFIQAISVGASLYKSQEAQASFGTRLLNDRPDSS